MYIPQHFAQPDMATLQAAIERYSFATLVSGGAGGLSGSHLPLLLERAGGASGTLLGHMARANAQWREANGQEVLAIFHGPHAYISPQWYQATEVVPTWNYVVVHAYGRLEVIEDEAATEALLERMVRTFEAGEEQPWQMSEGDNVQRLLKQIVAFRIPITRLEGKWKLNQNRPVEQRQKVIAVLSARSDEQSQEIAKLMIRNS